MFGEYGPGAHRGQQIGAGILNKAMNKRDSSRFVLVHPNNTARFSPGSSLNISNQGSPESQRRDSENEALTHYQTTNFRLFQTERVCRRQFQI